MGGILLIDKPRDWTSFDVIFRLRKLTGVQKIGHTGTLDPFADGLLPVCIGKATRLIQFMESHDKAYRVTVAFGRATDTQDRTGQVVFEHKLTDTERKE
ncbi:MAG: tRNA pseudouridine(55) synthase TruB, partial [Clostridia bacterium]|nr:tRNA pseudouridine(55) synthase TruB [Clostridia bacterium]